MHKLLTFTTTAALALAPLAVPTTAQAMSPTSSVCGAGRWSVAGTAKAYPGTVALYRQNVSARQARFCGVFFNTSGKAVRMRAQLWAQPSADANLTRRGLDQGTYTRYAGPLTTTVARGHHLKVRVYGWGDHGSASRAGIVETIA